MDGGTMKQRIYRFRKVLGLALLCLSAHFCYADAALNSADTSVLNTLSAAWGANNLKWGTGDPCTWQGVVCDSTGSTVIKLLLQASNLAGAIPSAIGSFTGLQQLDLSYNPALVGPIPNEIGNLATLQQLIIQQCALAGQIPTTIGNLKNLQFLALNNNYLTGSIPSQIGSLQQLYWFDLSTNNLSGIIPVSTNNANKVGLDTMPAAMHLHFNNNSLTGPLPPELGAPPGGVVKLTNVIHLLLENNQLNGTIPDSIANLTSLQILSLSNNKFTGPIPTSLNSMATGPQGSTIQQILLGGNQLTGLIPNYTALLPNLSVIEFSRNNLSPQAFPTWLTNGPSIQTVYLEYANLIGQLPEQALAIPSLQTMWVRNNSLNGTLAFPATVGPNFLTLSAQDNQIANYLNPPNANVNLSAISIELDGNPICASTNPGKPTQLCGELVGLEQPWTSPFETICNVSCSGTTLVNPLKLGNCNCTQPLEIQLQARRPTFSVITDPFVETLRLNLVAGLGLQNSSVWISSGSFTSDGRANFIVDFFAADGVSNLDSDSQSNITHSLTSDAVPLLDILPYLASIIVSGSTFLNARKGLSKGAIVGIVFGVLAALALVALYAVFQRRRAERFKHITNPFGKWGKGKGENELEAPQVQTARFFSYPEIKKITNNFAEANVLGVGGYGKVYSGVLDNGTKVAVKRAAKDSMQGSEEFKTEIELLSRVHHKNLVGLVGYCYDQGEQMLVYEFMPNGTISEWLRGKMAYPLDWSKRLSIAVGSARGLAYLHEHANPPIIHRDIKSQNILLDEKHVAKVADFGLSKQAPDGADMPIQTNQVKGTLGYLDPEYYMTQELSEKSDVYSFGVVLLELITSKAPIQNGKYIVREVRTALQEGGMKEVETLLDPSVFEASEEDRQRFIDLALSCVVESGANRPTMNEVVRELENLASRNKPKAKASAQATDPTWLTDVYGDDSFVEETGTSSNFRYTGQYDMPRPEPK